MPLWGLGCCYRSMRTWARNYNAPLKLVLIFQDAKNDVLNWLKSKLFHFSVDHNDIFDHKYCIDPGNLFSMLKNQYLT